MFIFWQNLNGRIYTTVHLSNSNILNTKKENYFVTAARLEPYKRIDLLVKAFNHSKEKLIIIGSGSQKRKLIKRITYKKRTNTSNPWVGEVEVALGRDGRLIKINSGNHRFACAYFFEIHEIPVNLCVVHSEYIDLLKKNGIKQFNKKISKIVNAT